MKMTRYFRATRSRPDRVINRDEWIRYVIESPEGEHVLADGRVRRWARIDAMQGRYLCVVVLPDRDGTQRIF